MGNVKVCLCFTQNLTVWRTVCLVLYPELILSSHMIGVIQLGERDAFVYCCRYAHGWWRREEAPALQIPSQFLLPEARA